MNNNQLRTLNLGDNIIDVAGMIKIAEALQNISCLRELHINDNWISGEVADDIAAVILNNNYLQTLNLSDNPYETAGMIKITKALQGISTLCNLYATNCSIVQDAADDIAAVILNNKSLQKLDLDENYFAAIGI